MNVTEEEKSKAHILLNKCKERERKKELVPVNIGNGISIMLPSNFTKKQLEEKKKKYIKP